MELSSVVVGAVHFALQQEDVLLSGWRYCSYDSNTVIQVSVFH